LEIQVCPHGRVEGRCASLWVKSATSLTPIPSQQAMTPTPERMNAAQAASFLGIEEKTVRKYTSARRIPFIRISGRCVRYDRAALGDWLLSRTVKPINGK
jgi:excisionase family DNA binding protein